MDSFNVQAKENLADLARDPYPGRGIVMGKSKDGKNFVQIYWIMGRSGKSRNRRFEKDDSSGKVWTEIADLSKLDEGEDTSLLLYTAMDEAFGFYAVSNGIQTDDIINNYLTLSIDEDEAFRKAIFKYEYEPDGPNFTPRISAVSYVNPKTRPIIRHTEMSIIKKSNWEDNAKYTFFPYKELMPGIGFCIHTYDGDGNPLPAFSGEPYPLPLDGNDIETIAYKFWVMLNIDNKVSLVTKFVNLETGKSELYVINAY